MIDIEEARKRLDEERNKSKGIIPPVSPVLKTQPLSGLTTEIPEVPETMTPEEQLFKQFKTESVTTKLEEQRDIERMSREAYEKGNILQKITYSAGVPADIRSWKYDPVGNSLRTLIFPLTLSSRYISGVIDMSIPLEEEDILNEMETIKSDMRIDKRVRDNDTLVRQYAVSKLKTDKQIKNMLGERQGETELVGWIAQKTGNVALATTIGTIGALAAESPYWLAVPPYTQLIRGAIKGAEFVTRPIARAALEMPGVKAGLKAGQVVGEYPLEDLIRRYGPQLKAALPKYTPELREAIAKGQIAPLSAQEMNRAATGLDKLIYDERQNVLREYHKAIDAGEYNYADHLIREIDNMGSVPDLHLAQEALRTQTPIELLSEDSIKKTAKKINVGKRAEETIPKAVKKDASYLQPEETVLYKKQIENINRVLPGTSGKTQRVLLRKRDAIQNKLDNSRTSFQAEPYIPPEVQNDPILNQARLDLQKYDRQFNLYRGARADDDVLYGFKNREADKFEYDNIENTAKLSLSEANESNIKKWMRTAGEYTKSIYKIMPDNIWRPMQWSDNVVAEYNRKVAEEFKGLFGLDLEDFGGKGKFAEQGLNHQRLSEYMTERKLPRVITDSLKQDFNLTDKEIDALGWAENKLKYLREQINTRYPGMLPLELDNTWYSSRVTPSNEFMRLARSQRIAKEIQLEKGKLGVEEANEVAKQLKILRKMEEQYNIVGTVSYKALPKEVRANFMEMRKLADPLLEFNYWDNFIYYVDRAARKLYREPVLKHISREINNISDITKRKFTAQMVRKWTSYGLEDSGIEKLSRSLIGMTNFYYLTSPTQIFTNLPQHANTFIEAGPAFAAEAALRVAAKDPEMLSRFNLSMYKNDVLGLTKPVLSKLGTTKESMLIHPIQMPEPGLRMTAYEAGCLEAKMHYERGWKTDITDFVRRVVERGFPPEMAYAMHGDRLLEDTQFIYGLLGLAKFQQNPYGRPLFLYTSYTTKQLELFASWLRHNPQKFLAYGLLTYGAKDFAKYIGVDVANVIGAGIDEKKFFNGGVELGLSAFEPDKTVAKLMRSVGMIQLRKSLEGLYTGGGLMPSRLGGGFGPLETIWKGQTLRPYGIDRLFTAAVALEQGQGTYKYIETDEDTQKKWLESAPGKITKHYDKQGYPYFRMPMSFSPALRPKYLTPDEKKEAAKYPLQYVFTPYELALRTIVGRPYEMRLKQQESEANKSIENQRKQWHKLLEESFIKPTSQKTMATFARNYILLSEPEAGARELNNLIIQARAKHLLQPKVADWLLKTVKMTELEKRKDIQEKKDLGEIEP